MSAAGSWAEVTVVVVTAAVVTTAVVTAALKHAAERDKKELKRLSLMFSTPHEEQEGRKKEAGPWRVAGGKLQAAFRKEAGPRCGGQAEVTSFISKVLLMRLGQWGGGP